MSAPAGPDGPRPPAQQSRRAPASRRKPAPRCRSSPWRSKEVSPRQPPHELSRSTAARDAH